MKITFIPQRRDDGLVLEKTAGNRLRINGELFNFNPLNDGDLIKWQDRPSDWFAGPIEKVGDEVCLSVFLPCHLAGWEALDPVTLTVAEDGLIALPEVLEDADVES